MDYDRKVEYHNFFFIQTQVAGVKGRVNFVFVNSSNPLKDELDNRNRYCITNQVISGKPGAAKQR